MMCEAKGASCLFKLAVKSRRKTSVWLRKLQPRHEGRHYPQAISRRVNFTIRPGTDFFRWMNANVWCTHGACYDTDL